MPLLHAFPSASRLAGLSALLVLGVTLSGCSAEGASEDTGSRTTGDVAGASQSSLQLRTTVARVQGSLTKAQRARIERTTSRLISDYLAAAYLHERSGDGYRDAFPGFTAGARALALRDVETVADAELASADEVRPGGAVAFLSVLAPEGRPAGATARVFLDLRVTEGGRDRTVPVRGRLMLTPGGDGWEIFGYDLSLDTAGRRSR